MLGCNFHCAFCQNWFSSQAGKDQCSEEAVQTIRRISPERVIQHAIDHGAKAIASSYNEPLITTEWAVEIFKLAKESGLKTLYVSNGFSTPEVLEYLRPWLDGYKVDLKSMQETEYRKMGARLQPVLETIRRIYELGLWLEVVTLVIPGLNDSSEELWDTGRFLVSISPDIPWHVTAYHPDYKYVNAPPTPSSTLQRAAEIGQEAGLRYVYAGNLPGKVGSLEDTNCPHCAKLLIARHGYHLTEYHITSTGECAFCSKPIPGVWGDDPLKSRWSDSGYPYPIY
jgi:pyruvate formate lyase activating enzyme